MSRQSRRKRHSGRLAWLMARLQSGCSLVLTISEGSESWSLSDGTRVQPEEAGFLRHALKLVPRDPGLFPGELPQSWSCINATAS
jgi:hypothetical protein